MTMQIAMQATDGFVLVSDIKNRFGDVPVSSFVYHSKIRHVAKHGLLISLMGYTADPDADPGGNLASHLQSCTVADRGTILQWARGYAETRDTDKFSLLIVSPTAQYDRMWKITIRGNEVEDRPSVLWHTVHGNENNPAIFWLEYFRCRGKCSVEQATNIAALTILMGEHINPYGIEGLEIWQYRDSWAEVTPSALERIIARCRTLQEQCDRLNLPSQNGSM